MVQQLRIRFAGITTVVSNRNAVSVGTTHAYSLNFVVVGVAFKQTGSSLALLALLVATEAGVQVAASTGIELRRN